MSVAKPETELYQTSDLGLIPRDWSCETLKSIDLLTGFPFPSAGYSQSGIKLLRGSNIKRNSTDWSEGLVQYWPQITPDLRRYLLHAGDVVVAMDGSLVGRSFASLTDEDVPALLLQRVARLRSSSVYQKYLAAWVCSDRFTAHLDKVKTVTAIPHISPADIRSFKIALPPTQEEQKRIADALADADKLIESLESLIAKKRAIKQGAMQELLSGSRRLAGFSGEWAYRALGSLFTFKNGLNKAKSYFGAGTPIINFMDVLSLPHIKAGRVKGQVTLSSAERDNFSARRRDVFFTRTSETVEEVGTASVLADEIPDAVFSGFVLRARPRCNTLDNIFLGYALRAEQIRRQIVATASYTTRALTNGRLLSNVTLAVPPHDEQEAIGKLLSDMDTEINALECRLAKTRQIKQGMMQKLLTGRIRLV